MNQDDLDEFIRYGDEFLKAHDFYMSLRNDMVEVLPDELKNVTLKHYPQAIREESEDSIAKKAIDCCEKLIELLWDVVEDNKNKRPVMKQYKPINMEMLKKNAQKTLEEKLLKYPKEYHDSIRETHKEVFSMVEEQNEFFFAIHDKMKEALTSRCFNLIQNLESDYLRKLEVEISDKVTQQYVDIVFFYF